MYQLYNGQYECFSSYGGSFQPPNFSTDCLTYWQRSFFQRMRSMFKFTGLPEAGPGQVGWDYDAFIYQLLKFGYAVVFNSKKYGLVVQPGTPTGFGLQFEPRGMMIATPFFRFERPLEIGKECAVIKLTPDFRGVWDVIQKYAVEMQYTETAVRQSLINARFAYSAVAKDDKMKRSLEAMFEKLENGNPAVVVNEALARTKTGRGDGDYDLPIFQFDRDLKKNFILPELYEIRRTVLTDFYRELGIRVQPDKKERMIVTEAQTQDAETFNRREVWKISLDESLKVCNTMYNTSIAVEINEPPELANENGGADDADVSRDADKSAQRGGNA